MPSIRQEKMARVIKEAVSEAIANHLSDPRIEGFISVTQVNLPPDLRFADVYLSVFGVSEKAVMLTFKAITHASHRIQSVVSNRWHSKYCPTLRFHLDENFKKTLETMKLIEEANKAHEEKEKAEKEQQEQDDNPQQDQ
ncbi:MAG: ribosome-binding factor A [Planctomycetes bacterium GWF2_50_10]|nr:MAG: ribosome-binding factor A [Planctomycetes bacterium GWF2_50_10]